MGAVRKAFKEAGLQCYSKNFDYTPLLKSVIIKLQDQFKTKNLKCMCCYVFLSDESKLM